MEITGSTPKRKTHQVTQGFIRSLKAEFTEFCESLSGYWFRKTEHIPTGNPPTGVTIEFKTIDTADTDS